MKKRQSSVDGFIPRHSGNNLGEASPRDAQDSVFSAYSEKKSQTDDENTIRQIGKQQTGIGIRRSDIDGSLRDIDDVQDTSRGPSRKQRRRLKKMAKKPKGKIKRVLKWFVILLIIAILSTSGLLAYKFFAAGGNIFQGSLFDIFQSQALKTDSNGRSNFLILGTTEDDPGHPGSNLTDTMMVLSISQKDKDAYIFSVPRDLYVQYGMACASGYEGKINVYFSCANGGIDSAAEQDRLAKTQNFVGNIFGMDIQYGIHVNETVVKEAVDAVGGIDVDIVGDGAPGILDRNFDWRCNYTCYLVKYTNGVHHLDGLAAMYLSMARGDTAPTYGLAQSNFDREKNQQKILIALRNKAMSTGILTNIGAIAKLIDTLGSNLRTNIQTNEIRTLMQVAGDIKTNNIHMLSLIDGNTSVVTTGNYGGASVVMPSAGIYDYSGIQAYINKNLNKDPIAKEAAPIVVLNGTDKAGLGQARADVLTKDGFNIVDVNNAPTGIYDPVEIYQISSGDTATAKKLTTLYDTTIKTIPPPVKVDSTVRFVIIFGATG
jgi:LCP family protein required for cell wall assembly